MDSCSLCSTSLTLGEIAARLEEEPEGKKKRPKDYGLRSKVRPPERFNPGLADKVDRDERQLRRKLERRRKELLDDACTPLREPAIEQDTEEDENLLLAEHLHRAKERRTEKKQRQQDIQVDEDQQSETKQQEKWMSLYGSRTSSRTVHPAFKSQILDQPVEDFAVTLNRLLSDEETTPKAEEQEPDSPRIVSKPVKTESFVRMLDKELSRPFNLGELLELAHKASEKKPVLSRRELRRDRSLDFPTSRDGPSYLHYYPDFDKIFKETREQEEKLKLLRGFFFWIEHRCVEGSFPPWRPKPSLEVIVID